MVPAEGQGELEFLRRLRQRLKTPGRPGGAVGAATAGLPRDLCDDMAAIHADSPLLWTVDMLMDGVDFDSGRHAWYDIGRKAMAVNLSDCAAMAARPVAALSAVALNRRLSLDDALALHGGAHDFGLRYGCPIVGGDTNGWNAPTVISITVAAQPEPGRPPVRRDGARPGDRIWLTGPVGGSILGRHLTPEPRIDVALAVNRELRPHAMIDISDGLALDLWRIMQLSHCGAVLEAAALEPLIHPDAVQLAQHDGRPPREHALHDGEDFELIVVLPADADADACAALGLRAIGHIQPGRALLLAHPDGRREPIEPRGWEHLL